MIQDVEAEIRAREQRFWAQVDRGDGLACWNWPGTKVGRSAYGKFYIGKRAYVRAHRAAVILSGRTIPDGMVVCHSCDNPSCCNPSHLFIGTLADNNADMVTKGRQVSGSRKGRKTRVVGSAHGCAKLTEAQVRQIVGDTRSSSVLAPEYGVSVSTICRIRKGDRWSRALASPAASNRGGVEPQPQATEADRGR